MEASTRVIGMSVGKAACSIASLSMVSQKSSTCTSSDTENSGQVNCRKGTRGHNKRAHSQTSKQSSHCQNKNYVALLQLLSPNSHFYILELQDIVCVSLCNFYLWSNAANATDHIVVISYGEALKGPVATQEKFLNLRGFIWIKRMDWGPKPKEKTDCQSHF